MRSLKWFAVLMSIISNSQAQIDPRVADYSVADSIALNFPDAKPYDYVELASRLTKDLDSEHDKFRAIFRWITDNITYHYGNRSGDPKRVLKKQKAVCIGYSSLLRDMCLAIGIECEVISGFSKTTVEDIGKRFKTPDHAWNAVNIYDKWYLVDVTWATSYYDKQKRKIIKQFNETYFLTDPTYFGWKHFPTDPHWQLSDKPISLSQFKKGPIFYSGLIENHIEDITPGKGTLKIKQQKKSLELTFLTHTEPRFITISLGDDLNYFPDIEKDGDLYIARQIFDKPGTHEMTIFINGIGVATYKLIVKK